ncbi:hypothetical protein KAW80_04615 [Candidatus Babeliales bacterium]|nr:hypothetical protein [Candidatus Babeliales bacterium]
MCGKKFLLAFILSAAMPLNSHNKLEPIHNICTVYPDQSKIVIKRVVEEQFRYLYFETEEQRSQFHDEMENTIYNLLKANSFVLETFVQASIFIKNLFYRVVNNIPTEENFNLVNVIIHSLTKYFYQNKDLFHKDEQEILDQVQKMICDLQYQLEFSSQVITIKSPESNDIITLANIELSENNDQKSEVLPKETFQIKFIELILAGVGATGGFLLKKMGGSAAAASIGKAIYTVVDVLGDTLSLIFPEALRENLNKQRIKVLEKEQTKIANELETQRRIFRRELKKLSNELKDMNSGTMALCTQSESALHAIEGAP